MDRTEVGRAPTDCTPMANGSPRDKGPDSLPGSSRMKIALVVDFWRE